MKLAEWLRIKGMSQQTFGNLIGVSQSAVAKFVLEIRHPTRETIVKIDEVTNGEVPITVWFDDVPSRVVSATRDPSRCPSI